MTDLNASIILSLIDRVTAPARRVQAQFAGLSGQAGKTARSLSSAGKEAGSLGLKLGALGGVIGYGFKSQLVDTASQFEGFGAILETVEGSAGKAKNSLAWVSDFAARTPYELDQVMESFVKLRAYGMDPTKGLLKSLGDTAAAMGKPMIQAVEAIADAVTGENERLKEFGIRASVKGDQITYEYTNKVGKQMKKTADKNSRAMIQSTLEAIWNEKYAGAMERQAGTWKGMWSNISDQITRFKIMVMQAGVFDYMKGKLKGLLDQINEMAASGKLKEWAVETGATIKSALEETWKALSAGWGIAKKLGRGLAEVADICGGWKPVLAGLAAIMAGPLLLAITSAAGAIVSLGAAIMATPVGWIAAGVTALAAGAYIVAKNWTNLKNTFSNIWASIKAIFATGVQSIRQALYNLVSFLPDWALPKGLEPANLKKKIDEYAHLKNPVMKKVDWKMPGLSDVKADLFGAPSAIPETGAAADKMLAAAEKMERAASGKSRVQIDVSGPGNVKDIQAGGGMEIQVDRGLIMRGAGGL